HDAANHDLDVFGVSSTDGGVTFSANSRITNTSFDPDAGRFLAGSNDYSFGDAIGLAAIDGTALAVSTDTRPRNQDLLFARYSLASPPAPLPDRFEPNDLSQTATDLGRIAVPRVVPRLSLVAGDDDWFRLTAAASGDLIVSVSPTGSGIPQVLELWSADGRTQ